MDAKLKADWVKALRSGEYRQAQYKLRRGKSLCCIGVCYVVHTGHLPDFADTGLASKEVGLTPEQQDKLTMMNDFKDNKFPEIADYIEQNL